MREHEKSLLKNTLIYAIGNFGSKILAFLLLPLYTYYLTKKELGTYDLFLVTISLLTPLITLQISDATYRWLIEKDSDDIQKSKIISNGFFVILTFSLFFYLIILIFTQFYLKIEYSLYFSIILLLSIFLPFFQKVLRGLKMNLLYALSGILSTFFILILNIVFLAKFNLKIKSLFLASIISNIIVLFFILYKIKAVKVINLDKVNIDTIKEMILYSLPLVPNSISWWLINASDKYLILLFLNIDANGIYAISTRFPSILMLINSIFIMAWQDHGISESNKKENRKSFSKIFNTFITLELTAVIILISITPYLIKFLVDKKFNDSWHYLPLLFIGTAFLSFSAYLSVGYQKEKKTKGILITSIIGGLINLLISLILLKRIGLYAPALGTFISFLIVYLLRKKETNKFYYLKVNNKKLSILIIIALLFTYLINFENIFLNFIMIIISIILFLILNNNLLKSMITIITNKLKLTR